MELEKCGMCDFPEVTHHCAECPVYLCSRCSISHTRSKATNTHALADFTRVTTGTTIAPAEEPSLSAEPVPTFCSTHQDIQISIFCSTCNDIICRKCQQISHIDHQICDVDESKMNLQRLCLDNIKRLFDTSSTLETVDEELQSTKVANTQKLHQIETELTHRKNALFKHINSTYDESLSKVQNEKKRIEQVFERVTNERKDSMKLSQELKAKLFNVQHTDDISSLVSIVKDFNNVFPNIENVAVQSSTDAMRSICKGFLESKDNADRALSSVQQYLALEMNGSASTLRNDKSTPVSKITSTNGAQRNIANQVDFTSADDFCSSTLKAYTLSPRSTMPSSPQGQANPINLIETKTPVFTSRNKLPKTVYKDVEIIVKEGDITDEQVDCIVHGFRAQYIMNDKYSPIDLSGGIGKCIQRKAGQAFMNDCLKKFVQYGEIAVTIGGDLPCRKVLHADINPCIGTTSTPSSWAIFVEKCLTKVFDMGMKSVSFPIIGLGFLSARTLAEYQILGVKRFIDSKPKLIETITFVTQNNEEADTVFRDEIYKLCRDKQRKEDGPRFATDSSAVPNPTTLGGRTYAQATRPRVTLSVEVVLGDITKDDSDMIVHPTSNSLHGINFVGQPGVSISQVGGTSFNEECRSTTVQPKSYTVTNAGSLPCKKVLHVDAYSILGDDKDGWKRVIVSALKVANDYKMTSIAFTTFKIGTVHTKEDGVRIMAKCFKEAIGGYSPTHSTLKMVRFVVYKDQALYKILNEILAKPKSASVQADTSTPDNEYTLAITGSELVLNIVCGDLTTQRCGAIVHATGNPIHFGGKSGDAIKKAGGPLLEAAVKIARYKDTPVVFTQAGNLPCEQVLHLDMTCSKHENKIMKLKTLIMESLAAAKKEHIGVLSYPALGTGKWGCQPSQISTCFKDAISEFSNNQRISHLHEIRLVVFEKSMMQEFTQTLDTI